MPLICDFTTSLDATCVAILNIVSHNKIAKLSDIWEIYLLELKQCNIKFIQSRRNLSVRVCFAIRVWHCEYECHKKLTA